MQTELNISKRKQKSEETKRKLLDAIAYIMDEYDFNTVTIRNICTVSGVSYGSFYNLFDSKEDFLCYYLTTDFLRFKEDYYKDNPAFRDLSDIEKSIDIFVCCAQYNVHKGLKFIRAFYSPQNTTLCPRQEVSGKEYSFSPLVREATNYLQDAKSAGRLKSDIPIEETVQTYCFLFNGITFNWCVSNGQYDMAGLVKSSLTGVIDPYRI